MLIDRTRIRQVLINLLNNAARFTSQGEITIRVQIGAEECVVGVQDTGIGIPADELEQIFDVFHQIDLSIRRPTGGMGLGLGISKRFVELHGGRMWVKSVEGEGSTFFFSLPRVPQNLPSQLVELPSRRWIRNLPEPALVVVDSDPAVAEKLEQNLEGYQILRADDAAQAMELVDRLAPIAVIVNQSPRIQGLGPTARRLYGSLDELIPVLVCSMPSESWLTQEAGVLGSLTKPISRTEMLAALEKINGVHDILIVDDDRSFVQLVHRYLGMSEGYMLRSAYDGAEALNEIRHKRPDLILLDLAMPDMSGLELLAHMNEDEALRGIPTLIVTATDYSRTLQTQQGSLIAMTRRQPFGVAGTADQIKRLLESCQPSDQESLSEPLEALAP